ncbi:MAG: hypothetical protein OXQ29_18460, partial [Rhodospirillaceae bacterium]|nr:hypothetical protein [Rhodospirillaceae bacterium]
RLAAFCRNPGLSNGTVELPVPLRDVVRNGRRNDLTHLNHLRCRMGVYAFQLRSCVIYVGKCTEATSKWHLRKRVSQHLTRANAGGTLRINWYRRHVSDFVAYAATLAQCSLWTISFPPGSDLQKIAQLEHLMIGLLGPAYCDVPP